MTDYVDTCVRTGEAIDPIRNQQGPWTALKAYAQLNNRIADIEEIECGCEEFSRCSRCAFLDELNTEQNRLKSLYEEYWLRQLWTHVRAVVDELGGGQ